MAFRHILYRTARLVLALQLYNGLFALTSTHGAANLGSNAESMMVDRYFTRLRLLLKKKRTTSKI
jgi:hypothetical protein